MLNSGIFPVDNYWLSCDYGGYSGHTGIDLGFNAKWGAKVPVWAWRDGVVVHVGYDANSRGNYISLRHDYDDGTCQYTQYLHLDKLPSLKVGKKVKQGTEIGIRGGTPKYGIHLHFALTCATTCKNWTIQQIANNAIDSKKYLYKSKDKEYHFKYMYTPSEEKSSGGVKIDLSWVPDSPYPITVDRNENINQYEVTGAIRWRHDPSTDNDSYEYLVDKGIYNVLAISEDSVGRKWVKVDDEHYFCGWNADGSTDGFGEYYEAVDQDKKKIKELEAKIVKANSDIESLKQKLKDAENKIDKIKTIVK